MVLVRSPSAEKAQIQVIGKKEFNLFQRKQPGGRCGEQIAQQLIKFLTQLALDGLRITGFILNKPAQVVIANTGQ
jgi:hypothetical protein